ncbi:MAG: hypothetical protein ACRDRU_04205 [Pseudonocardiaceae bacterium]
MAREIKLGDPAPVFKGTDAVLTGALTRGQLRGPAVQRLFQGVYALASEPITHELRCSAAALALPAETVITGRSAAGLWGVRLARAQDCVQVVVSDSIRIAWCSGLDVRRTFVSTNECTPWSEVAVATPLRTTLDRLNRVQAAGWEIVFVTAQLLHDPARMVRTVRAALARRG